MGAGQMPMGAGQMPMGAGQMPMGAGQMPMGAGQMPMRAGQMPMGYGEMPGGYSGAAGYPMTGSPGNPSQYPADMTQFAPGTPETYGNPGMAGPYGMGLPYGQMPYGYPQMSGSTPQMMGAQGFESSEMMSPGFSTQMPYMPSPPAQSLPVGTGAMGDCGCGGPDPSMGSMQPAGTMPAPSFVPPTPPIYSAPYTGPINTAQPPFMNPYGMGAAGNNPYGMPGYRDESN